MKKRRVERIKSKATSLILAVCMVFTLLPVNPLAVYAAVSDKYQVAGTFLDMDGVTEGGDGAWEWNGSTKTLTFKKRINLTAIEKSGYKSVVLGLPGDATIVMNDGVLVKLTGLYGDGIYCEGNLTIKGNGALEIYGSQLGDMNVESDDLSRNGNDIESGYDGADEKAGSAIACAGKLTVGEDGDAASTPYVFATSRGYTARIIEMSSTSESLKGEDNPIVQLKSGQLNLPAFDQTGYGKIYCALGKDGYVQLTNRSVLQYPTENQDNCTISYPNGKKGDLNANYYYGTNGIHRYVRYNPNGGSEPSKIEAQRILVGQKADLTVTALPPENKEFMGWSRTADGEVLKELIIESAEVQPNVDSGIELYAIYAEKMETPAASLNYKDSKLTGLTANAEYAITVDGTTTTSSADENGEIKVKLSDLYGKKIDIIKKGNGTTSLDSQSQTITVLEISAAPSRNSFRITEAINGATEATVKDISQAYEYRIGDAEQWTDGDGSEVKVPAGQTIEIRKKATDKAPESQILTIPTKNAQIQEEKPNAGVDYRTESKLTNLTANAEYIVKVNNAVIAEGRADGNGDFVIKDLSANAGKDISVIKKGNGDTTYDSEPQEISIPAKGSAPSEDLFEVVEAGEGETEATIKNIEEGYEYSTDGGETWTDGDGSDVKVPGGTEILIREKATEDTPESEALAIKTEDPRIQEETPNAGVDYRDSKITNLTEGEAYVVTVDGEKIAEGEAGADKKLAIKDLSSYGGKEISVVKKGNGTTTYDSEPQKILIKAKGDAPSEDDFEVINATGTETEATIKNIPEGYEYSTDDGETWTDGDGSDIKVPAGTDVLIRKKATEDTPESESLTIATKGAQSQETTPEAGVNYKESKLTDLDSEGEYKVTVDGEVIAEGKPDADGKLAVEDLSSYGGKEISVIKKGDGETTYDSEPQKITILEKGDAPSADQFTVVEPAEGETEGTIKNIPEGYEYSTDDGETWTDGDGSDIKVPAGTDVLIREKATEDAPESESVTISVKDTRKQEETPEAGVNYKESKLTNLDSDGEYEVTVDGEPIAEGKPDANGDLAIEDLSSYGGKEISVVKKGDGETTCDSEPQKISVSKKKDAPSADQFTVVDPAVGETDATIKNIPEGYEYSTDDGKTWKDGDGSDIKVPAGTDVLIREKATEDTPSSEAVKIPTNPAQQTKTPEATPNVKVDYTTEKLTGFVPNAEYVIKVDGKIIIFKADAAGKTDLPAYYGKTITVTKKGNGTTTSDSAEQRLTVSAKTVAPSEDQFDVQPDENGGNVVIKNVSGDYEYSINNGVSWTTGNGTDITVPVGTIVLIRKKATAAAPVSNTVVIKTTAYPTLATIDKQILSANTDKGDVPGSTFAPLYLKATGKSKSIKLTWKKVAGASGYIVYGSACGKNIKMAKLTTLTSSKKSYTAKKLKANKYYKYMVVAYKTIDGKDYVISQSKVAHASTTKSAKYGNPKKITIKKASVTVKKGKKTTLKPKLTLTKKKMRGHVAKFRYESANTAIATVTKKGVVKGIKKGKTYVYIYAQNGVYKRVRITVK